MLSANLHRCPSLVSKPDHPRIRQGTQRRSAVVRAGLGDEIRDFFDFNKWAPKSSRTWRLRQGPGEKQLKSGAADAPTQPSEEASFDVLNQRISQLRSDARTQPSSGAETLATSPEEPSTSGASPADQTPNLPSDSAAFSSLSDEQFNASLNDRISRMGSESSMDGEEEAAAAAAVEAAPSAELTGPLLRELVYSKYGKTYDLSIVRRDIPGKTIVCLNVMWSHLEQKSFPMTEEEYLDKMDTIAFYVRSWGQEDTVRDFFATPPRPTRGLPSRPVVGIAISIRLDLPPAVIQEWFGP